jgi:hypothetical protein
MQRPINIFLTTLLSLCFLFITIPTSVAFAKTFSYCGSSGGTGGNRFSDLETSGEYSSDDRRLVEIRIRSGDFIDGIQTVYENQIGDIIESPWHGGTGGNLSVFKLDPDEYITRISGKYGWYIDRIEIVTSKGRNKGWGGMGGAKHYIYNAPPGSHIHGFGGAAGVYIDSIGVIFKTP